jgi:thymidylate kinase
VKEREGFVYLHIEGLDLAGKTTVCEMLTSLGGEHASVRRNCLAPDTNRIFRLADQMRKDNFLGEADTAKQMMGHLYYAALLADIELFERPETFTIQESTIILRSLAYYSARKLDDIASLFEGQLERHPRFDASVVLTAGPEVRLARLEKRQTQEKDRLSWDDFAVRDYQERFFHMDRLLCDYAQQSFGAVVIDTSDMRPEEVLQQILNVAGISRTT